MFGVFAIGEPMLADDLVISIIPPVPPKPPIDRGDAVPGDTKPKRTRKAKYKYPEDYFKPRQVPKLPKKRRIPALEPSKVKPEFIEIEHTPVELSPQSAEAQFTAGVYELIAEPLEAIAGESAYAMFAPVQWQMRTFPMQAVGILNPTDEEIILLAMELMA